MTKEGWNWISSTKLWHYFTKYGASLCGDWVIDRNDSIPGLGLYAEGKCKECHRKIEEKTES